MQNQKQEVCQPFEFFFRCLVSETMRLLFVLVVVLQVVPGDSLQEVSGYVGDDVTLPSGAHPTWKLSKVVWSIFSNSTWIATYHGGREITERFHLYRGRLSLNVSSGDLMIRNLNMIDAMEYRADLITAEGLDSMSKIKLLVRERLQKPTLETVAAPSVGGGCWVMLRCSSPDEGVDLTWTVEPPGVALLNGSDRDGGVVSLTRFLDVTPGGVRLTCTSSRGGDRDEDRGGDRASSAALGRCDDDPTLPHTLPPPLPQPKNRINASCFVGGVLLGSLTVFLILLFRERMHRKVLRALIA